MKNKSKKCINNFSNINRIKLLMVEFLRLIMKKEPILKESFLNKIQNDFKAEIFKKNKLRLI